MVKTALTRLTILLLLLALCLSGCARNTQLSAGNSEIVLPEPETRAPEQITGDSHTENNVEIALHYASRDAMTLSTVTRSIPLAQNDDLLQKTLEALIESAALSGTMDAQIKGIESGGGIVSVDLNMDAAAKRSDSDYLLLCASIANTLLQFEDVNAVNILTGGRSSSICGLPAGAFVDAQDNIAALYAQTQSESDRFPSQTGDALYRNVLLYFPSADGKYVLPEVRELSFRDDDYAAAILRALSDGPLMRACCNSALPNELSFLEDAPELTITASGERVLELRFSSVLINYLSFSSMEEWQLYASIVLSMCSFIPELDAVRFYIDQEVINSCYVSGHTLNFEDGMMRRCDFSANIGSCAQFCFANEAGELTSTEYPLSASEAASPLNILQALIQAEPLPESGLQSVFPEGIFSGDILGVENDGQTAIVNLSANFYARCQTLNAQQERLLIYAMVNTLTELDSIRTVSFLVEGETIDALAHDIYLGVALLPDHGMMQTQY